MIEGFAVGFMVCAFLVLTLCVRKRLFWLVLLVTPIFAFSQNCDYIVSDEAGMLSGTPRDRQVLIDANDLINQGADVKIRTLPSSGGNLDMAINAMEARCPSWQGANGARKSTLLVIAVSKDRKYGIYFGSAWHKAFDAHWNRIKVDYMLPRLKSGDTTGALIAAEEQLTKRLIASKDETLKPVVSQSTVVNQAADVSGLWPVLWGLLMAGIFVGGIWAAILLIAKRRREKEAIQTAQQSAIAERTKAAGSINILAAKIAKKKEAGETVPPLADASFTSASEDFVRIPTLFHTDPDRSDLTLSEYNSITSSYRAINQKLTDAAYYLTGGKVSEPVREYPKSQPYIGGTLIAPPLTTPMYSAPTPTPTYTPPAPTYATHSSDVVIINNQQSTYVAPEPVYEEPIRHHHHRYEDDNDRGGYSSSSSSNSSSSDSGGGGSSSWSDSSSSDSSSSDSGGGGSSDF